MNSSIFIFSLIVLFIGLSFGSFVNVCIYRLPKNKQVITGRSYCPKCKKKIKWFDNIPLISFLSLNGRCRSCKKKISPQYFIVELIAGIGFLLIYLSYDNHLAKLLLAILLLMYLTVFFIDLKHFIIPDILNYGIIVIAFLKNFLPDLNLSFIQDIKLSLMGGIAGFFSIWIIIYLYKTFKKKEGMGLGDAKLMAGVGLLFGWQSIPFVLFLAAVLGLLMVMPSLYEKKKSLKSQVPFGPYIITAGVIYFLYGDVLYKMALGI
uniref:Putative bacterial peptidase A24 N-terminal domain protein n=1 Tax=uncultured marine microorganism HF4000_010L19 TaxID=455518 RepID=B3T1P0_9ZZZZ|nr:putative bacterial peptidase A24 N-terminal domain protein [uncultured marine microorganism HF4000_010L19]